jgi:hypothetical protein
MMEFLANRGRNNASRFGLSDSKDQKKGALKTMHTTRSLFGIACRAAALSFLVAGSASLTQAQQSSSLAFNPKALFLASASAPLDLSASSSSSSSSSLDSAVAPAGLLMFDSAAHDASQPPPRRRYGRPNYSDSHSNPDGSSKYTFIGGFGLALPVGITHKYETASWGLQVGGGRNFNQSVGILLDFDYDHFGLQGATLANQNYVYDYGCPPGSVSAGTCGVFGLDGNNHVWSFSINPTFTLATTGSMGAYVVVGAGFYHKVTNFTEPATGTYCDYYGYCYQYTANQVIDHYTSNAPGFSGGLGLTWKFSKFSNQRFYIEGRYVFIVNQHYNGITAANVSTSTYRGFNFYPANSDRTSYIPIKFGIRF